MIAADTGQPIVGAIVRASLLAAPGLTGPRPAPVETTTDAEGRFQLTNVPAGTVNLSASAPGFLTAAYRPTSPSQPPQFRPGERRTGAVLRLERAAVITGTVRDDNGAPVQNARIDIYRRGILTTRRAWLSIRRPAMTDASGTYVVNDLEPGEYVIAVPVLATTIPATVIDAVRGAAGEPARSEVVRRIEESRAPLPGPAFTAKAGYAVSSTGGLTMHPAPAPSAGSSRVYRTTYHPSANQLNDAGIVTVGGGERRDSVDVVLRALPARRLSGTLRTISGEPAAFTGIHLFADHADERSIDMDVEAAVGVTDATGAFTLLNLAPGDYRLKVAIMPAPPGRTLPVLPAAEFLTAWAARAVTVDVGDVELGAISLQRPLVIRGRHVFSGAGAANPMATPSRLWTGTVDNGMHSPPVVVRTTADGQFVMSGAMPGRYHLLGGGAPGWTVKAVTADGRDITGSPVELVDRDVEVTIHVTSRPTLVSGVVRDASGGPVGNAHVVAFPADYMRWINNGMSFRVVRSVRTREDGIYSVGALPPGMYLFAAFPDGDMQDWPDRRVVEAAGKAGIQIELPEGARVEADLPVRRLIRGAAVR